MEMLDCRAKLFVLAMGSIENARRLLIWNRENGDNLGNRHGLVGRYYLQHLHQKAGQFVRFSSAGEGGAVAGDRAFFAGTRDFVERAGIGAFRLYSVGIACSPLADELTGTIGAARCADIRSGADLYITAEHHPDPESRIGLASAADEFGDARAWLDFRIGEGDARTLREASVEFGRYLVRSEMGRLRVHPNILSGQDPVAGWTALSSAPGAAGHQMGGARMSASPADGVVDRDCKVWGVGNLYVAGAAVFRTCGHATPTLTIAQLALRLADRLHRVLSSM
jgi:choline dehydrogenase-like flavoprotein